MENPRWLTEETRTHAQALSQAMDDELRARPTPPARYERVFDDGRFMLLRCCPPAKEALPYEAFELRFSERNTHHDPQALVRMGAALAHMRREPVLIGDENEAQDISVSLTATPRTTPSMLLRAYDEQRAEFKSSALMHQAQADVLAQRFSTLPAHTLACESRDGKVHEYTMTFARPMAPEALQRMGARIAHWCNDADEGTNEQMQQLRETLNVPGKQDAYQVVAGPSFEGANNALTIMVPEGFTYSSMALQQRSEHSQHRNV